MLDSLLARLEMVDLDYLASILNLTGPACSVLQFLTGSQLCYTFAKKGSVGDASSAPFVAGGLCAAVWFKYGLLIEQPAVSGVNLFGVALFAIYTAVFYRYAARKLPVMRQTVFAIGFFVAVSLVLGQLRATGKLDMEKKALGLLAAMMSVAFCASPLASVGHVIRTRNTESLPFALLVMNFVTTFQWWMFGLLINDPFVNYPNMIGCILSGVQLGLFLVYPNHRTNAKKSHSEESIL